MNYSKHDNHKPIRRCTRLRNFLLAFLSAIVTPAAVSQTYNSAHALYQKGNFNDAEIALKKSLGNKPAKSEQAKIYKLMGICQFMLNNKSAAATSFKQALALQANLQIASSEVLDEAVIAFFNSQKRSNLAAAMPASRLVNRQNTAATPSTNKPKSLPQPLAGTKVMKSTFLKVLSNVTNASVSIDGILAGQANNLINTDPGQIEIEVSAASFASKTVKVNIIKNRENTITVNLEKPKIKSQPKPVATAVAGAPLTQHPGVAASPASDPIAEFAMDAATGGASAYTSPSAAAPNYQPPTMYYAAPPAYSPPPMPGIDATMGQSGYDDGLPPDPAEPATSSQGSRRAPSAPRKRFLFTIAPFGGGQFQNRDYIMGSALAAGELFAFANYLILTKKADAKVREANNHIAAKGGVSNFNDDDKQYIKKSDAWVKSTRKQADLQLKIFFALWGAGVIDAFTNDPPPETKSKTPKRRRFQPLMTATRANSSLLTSADAAAIDQERKLTQKATWTLGISPFIVASLPEENFALDTRAAVQAALLSGHSPSDPVSPAKDLGIHLKLNWQF